MTERDHGSEADRLEQQMPATYDPDEVDELDADVRAADVEASEGDLIEQTQSVPIDDEDDRY